MKKLVFGLGVLAASWTQAVTVLDFAQEKEADWRVEQCRFLKGEKQLRVASDGLHFAIDRAKTNPRTTWGAVLPKSEQGACEVPLGEVRVVCRYAQDGIVRTPGNLRLVDAQGEIFPFAPVKTTRIDDRVVVTYNVFDGGHLGAFFAGRPKSGATHGKNRNDHLDLPLRYLGVTFGLSDSATEGEVVLVRIESGASTIAPTVTVRRRLLDLEEGVDNFYPGNHKPQFVDGKLTISNYKQCVCFAYRRHPGMKPFPLPGELILRTSKSADGVAVLNLKEPATGGSMRLKAPWRDETVFVTNPPSARLWQLGSIEFWRSLKRGEKTYAPMVYTVDAFEGRWRTTAAEALTLAMNTGNPLHIVREGTAERPLAQFTNDGDRAIAVKGTIRARDFHNKGFDLPLDVTIEAGRSARVAFPWPLAKGIWHVYADITADDGSTANLESRFAVLDRHVRAPRLARGACFRPGINWHAANFSPKDRRLTVEALVACGCKLVRAGGFAFAGNERKEGEFDWSRADDIMAETKAAGISIDAIIYAPPVWSQDTNRIAKVNHFKKHMTPPRVGTFEAYAEKLTARYGTDVDYYEIGNEWDLIPAAAMTCDEAVRIHHEGYVGGKRGCAEANVICNGWTSPDVREDHYGKDVPVNKGMIAYVMPRIKGETSCFPIHQHSPFEHYRGSVQRFLRLRKNIGMEHLPWYANETALSSVNGQEDRVARDIFRKVMYAWANGSIDYIWYNLVATGWVPSDAEQGYGIMTADYYPRAGYAAFSAFTAVYLGLAYESTLIDRATRLAYRFRGVKNGKHQIVLGGWDDAAVKPCALRVTTDATRAWHVDLMGERTPVSIQDGVTAWPISAEPTSFILEGATRAEVSAEDLANIPVRPGFVRNVPKGAYTERAPFFTLNTADRMVDFHQAIPETRHRVWKGPKDLSAQVWLGREGDTLRLRVRVTDDVRAAGDGVTLDLQVPGGVVRTYPFRHVSREGTVDTYEIAIKGVENGFDAARLQSGVYLNVRIAEDDGEGPDAVMFITSDVEPLKLFKFE